MSGVLSKLGILEGCELESRAKAFIRERKVATIIELNEGGACRLLFDAGGHIDVCGSADIWWRELQFARLECDTHGGAA